MRQQERRKRMGWLEGRAAEQCSGAAGTTTPAQETTPTCVHNKPAPTPLTSISASLGLSPSLTAMSSMPSSVRCSSSSSSRRLVANWAACTREAASHTVKQLRGHTSAQPATAVCACGGHRGRTVLHVLLNLRTHPTHIHSTPACSMRPAPPARPPHQLGCGQLLHGVVVHAPAGQQPRELHLERSRRRC